MAEPSTHRRHADGFLADHDTVVALGDYLLPDDPRVPHHEVAAWLDAASVAVRAAAAEPTGPSRRSLVVHARTCIDRALVAMSIGAPTWR